MSSFVLDTSVAVAWYLPEAFANPAGGWQARMLEERVQFIVPTLHYWEFAASCGRICAAAPSMPGSRMTSGRSISMRRCRSSPTESVLALALEYETTAYDAVYIGLAIHLDVPILTAERSSTPWVRKMGKRVHIILQ